MAYIVLYHQLMWNHNNERVMSRSPVIYANLKNLWRGNRVRVGMGNPFAYPASNSIPAC